MNGNQTALVLSGGGAYGAFAVGVMKVLFAGRSPATNYTPLEVNIFTGTSVGAFNAAMMAGCIGESFLDTALHLERVWLDRIAEQPGGAGNGVFRLVGDPMDYIAPGSLQMPGRVASNIFNDGLTIGRYFLGRTANFLASDLSVRQRFVGLINLGSFVDISPFEDLLRSIIHEQDISTSELQLHVVATNWITGNAVHFSNSDFHEEFGIRCIMASAAIPGIFPPVRIGRDIFVDGGVVDNTPLKPALNLGATHLHVVYLDPKPEYIPILGEPNTPDTLMRMYHIMLATKLNEDIETARWINSGLKAFSDMKTSGSASSEQLKDAIRIAGKISDSKLPYKPVTIHRYFPRGSVWGELGALDFAVEPIASMIEEGERSALLHDCAENGCILATADEQVNYA